ncbi:MAG: hypothetical protein KGH78_02220 [Candidatus Micrarchaeota archaeon]|nr:hypothetical protein [Candidatus Micrarchaeota archaeon]
MGNLRLLILGFFCFILGAIMFFNAGAFIPDNSCGGVIYGRMLLFVMVYEFATGILLLGGLAILLANFSRGKTTSGAFVLIIAVCIALLAVLVGLGVFGPAQFCGFQCIFPAGFACLNYSLSTNATLTINFEQSTSSPINITGFNCTSGSNVEIIPIRQASDEIYIPVGANSTIRMSCYSGGEIPPYPLGAAFEGTVGINYTEALTGFPHTVYGRVFVKVT